MDKYLITGFSGFVSRHFLDYLDNNHYPATILGMDISDPEFSLTNYKNLQCHFQKVDLLDKSQVDNIIYSFQPKFILHLASYSSVAFSWKNPIASFSNNTNIFLNLLEQVRALDLNCRILSIGSSEEYGNVLEQDMPLKEDHSLNPLSPYAVARVSQEMLSRVYVNGYGLDIVMTRSFNHIGIGQRDVFVVSSFAKQLIEIKEGKSGNTEMLVGDLTIIRDFLDVRDVVKAYYDLFKKGKKGEIYNVCSNNGVTLDHLLNTMISIVDVEVNIKLDPKLIRPSDNRIIIGDNSKLKKETGWKNSINLETSLQDIINYWKKRNENFI